MKKTFALFLLLLLLISPALAQDRDSRNESKTIAVLGSSVASGWVTSFKERYDMQNGYAYRLERLLADRGFTVINLGVPGDSTQEVLARMDQELAKIKADYVLIGLSLGNEGIEDDDPEKVSKKYQAGLKQIIERCRKRGMTPVLGLCYGADAYQKTHYDCIKKTNLLLNTWDLPSINLLGGLDDGSGCFPEGRHYDLYHPGNDGHEEYFLTIVPSLFDALEKGKPMPEICPDEGFVKVSKGMDEQPLSLIPDDLIHSFSLSFQIRKENPGPIGSIDTGEQQMILGMDKNGEIFYSTLFSGKITHDKKTNDQDWHWVTLSHRYFLGETSLHIDGQQAGSLSEQIEPLQFVLGGPADYRDWTLHRGALNQDEIQALHQGTLLQASLELYAPLREKSLGKNQTLENRAQSMTCGMAFPAHVEDDRGALLDKIEAATQNREDGLVVEHKKPVTIDTEIYADYTGNYEIAPQVNFVITREGEHLFFEDPSGSKAELFPESETRFFIKFPLAELTVTFSRGKEGKVEQLIFSMNGDGTPARKVT